MNPLSCSKIRGSLVAFAVAWSASQAVAGDLAGTISESLKLGALPGAVLTVVEADRYVAADSGGRYVLTGLPAGTYTVEVRYLGYKSKTQKVEVPETGVVNLDVSLEDDVFVLEAFKVEGYREGRSRALQQKQNQTNISDLIASDAIGNLPDRNVADAVSRIAGVNISLEQGEGRYASIRGVEPNLNQVMIDGAVAAAPGGTRLGRAVPLDTLGAGQVAQIEVVKSVTPDLDANSLGGTIKIKTASPFDRKGRFSTASVAVNNNPTTDKNNIEGRITHSDIFGGGKWGIAAGMSYDKRDYSNHWIQIGGWNLRSVNGADVYLPSSVEIKPEEGVQERWGGNISLEFRPTADTQFYFRPNYSTKSRFEHTVEVIHSVDNAIGRFTLLSPTSADFAGNRTRTERRDFRGDRKQELLSVATGFKHKMGNWVLEPMLTYSNAVEDRIYDNVLAFRNSTGGTGPVSVDWTDFDLTRVTVDPTVDVPSKYTLRRTREDYGIVEEDTTTAKLDATWNFENIGGYRGFIKSGVKYIHRDRVTDLESNRLVPVGSWNLASVGSTLPSVGVYENRFQSGFLIDHFPTFAYIAANPALTTRDVVDSAANSIEDDYQINEYIYAGYSMASFTKKKLTLLAGVRWERTDATIRAVEARFAGSTLLGRFPTSGSTSYNRFFPNAQAVYRFNEKLIGRLALTRTIGRPAYEDARPLSNFRYDPLGSAALDPVNYPYSGTLAIGNPQLTPYDSMNYDLSLEWYTEGAGIISLAAFRKDIQDPIYQYSETLERVVYNGIGLQTLSLSSRRNADQADITGLEFNIYQPFRFLPAPFDSFGIDANYTHITSNVSVPTRPGEDFPFFRQPTSIANVTLFFERGKFSARVAWNRTDEQLDTLGSTKLADIYRLPRQQFDVQARYRFTENFGISAAIRNLTQEKEQFSYGYLTLLRTSRLLDREFRVGMEYNF